MSKIFLLIVIGFIALSAVAFGAMFMLKSSQNAELAPIKGVAPEAVDNIDVLVSEEQALSAVKNRTEVVKYVYELEKLGKKVNFETQDDGEEWLIQVFEVVQNDNETPHTATFNWYRVNKNSGKISVDF